MRYDLEDHPDLKDAAWIRAANRRARREVRAQRLRARLRRHSGKIVSAVALVVIGAVLSGFYQAGEFGNVSLPDLPDAQLPYSGVNMEVPFAGTPAEQWPEGDKGIVAPDANPVFEQVRQALVAARLDPAMISEHKPDRFLAMLAPEAREHVAKDVGGLTTRLQQGTRLVPGGIRVSGTMTLGEKDGYPAVTADHVYAYAFEPPDPKKLFNQMEMVAAVRSKITYVVTPQGLWPADGSGFWYSIACKASKEGFLGPQFIEPPQHGTGVNDDKRYFSATGEMPAENTCD